MTLMTTKSAAQYLAVAPTTIRLMIGRGEIPAVRIGRDYRIDEADIKKFIIKNKTQV